MPAEITPADQTLSYFSRAGAGDVPRLSRKARIAFIIGLAAPVVGLAWHKLVDLFQFSFEYAVIPTAILIFVPSFIAFILGMQVITRVVISREFLRGYWMAIVAVVLSVAWPAFEIVRFIRLVVLIFL